MTSSLGGDSNAYLPQEAKGGLVTQKMDVYAFGVILLQLVTNLPVYGKYVPGIFQLAEYFVLKYPYRQNIFVLEIFTG